MKKFKVLFLTISFVLTFNFIANAIEKTNTALLNLKNNENNVKIEEIKNNFEEMKELVDCKTNELQNFFKEITEDEISLINKNNWSDEELNNFEDMKKQVEFIQKKLKYFDDEWKTECNKKFNFIENYEKIYESLAKLLKTGLIFTKTTDYALVFNKLVNIFHNIYEANNTLFQITQLKEEFQNNFNIALEEFKNKTKTPKQPVEKNDKLNIVTFLDEYHKRCSIMDFEKHKKHLDMLITIYSNIFYACEDKFYNAEVLGNLDFEKIEQQNINKLKLNKSTSLIKEEEKKKYNSDKKYNFTYTSSIEKIADEIMKNEYFNLEKIIKKEGLQRKSYCFVNNISNLKHIFNSINEINCNLLKILKNPEMQKDFEEIAKNANSCKDILNSNGNKKISTNVLQKAIVYLIKSYSKKAEFDSKIDIQEKHKSIINTKNEKVLTLMIKLHDKILNIMKSNNFIVEEKNEFTSEDIISFSNNIKTAYTKSLILTSPVVLQNTLNLWEFLINLFLSKDSTNEKNEEIIKLKDFIKKEQSKVFVSDDDYYDYYN